MREAFWLSYDGKHPSHHAPHHTYAAMLAAAPKP